MRHLLKNQRHITLLPHTHTHEFECVHLSQLHHLLSSSSEEVLFQLLASKSCQVGIRRRATRTPSLREYHFRSFISFVLFLRYLIVGCFVLLLDLDKNRPPMCVAVSIDSALRLLPDHLHDVPPM